MADAKHSPHGDTSFWWSLTQHLGGALALVLVVAAAFWGVGQVRSDDDVPNPVVSSPDPQVAAPSTAEPTSDPVTEPSPSAPDEPEPEPTPEPTAEPPPEPTAEPTASPTADRTAAAGVSVQLLDATPEVEGDMQDLADRMRADGYRVVATNRAVRVYEQTTVFYTEGNEAAAREVADRYGFDVVEPKPSNLNDTVQVHVVVGQDYEPA